MGTRANIVIKDNYDELIFYRHSDGYPESVEPDLQELLAKVKVGILRDNVSQFSGHLILKGHEEYRDAGFLDSDFMSWKVGAYEPTTCIHEDIEFKYTLDLANKTLKTEVVKFRAVSWK